VLVTRKDGDAWSIQEHAGHLVDLDGLHDGRLDDYLAGAAALRAADLKNRKTHEAGHNDRPLAELLEAFRGVRGRFVARLEAWDPKRVLVAPSIRGCSSRCGWSTCCTSRPSTTTHHLAHMTELGAPGLTHARACPRA
jgi:hypothetical protein